MMERVNKLENSGKVRVAMQKAGMDDGMINTILETINDMQDRVVAQTNDKLEQYSRVETTTDIKNELEVLSRRITFSEGAIQDSNKFQREINEKAEINKGRIQKILNEIEVLRRALHSPELSQQASRNGLKLEDLESLDVSGEGMERITNMIKVVDNTMKKQFSSVERKLKRLSLLEVDVADLKANGGGGKFDAISM